MLAGPEPAHYPARLRSRPSPALPLALQCRTCERPHHSPSQVGFLACPLSLSLSGRPGHFLRALGVSHGGGVLQDRGRGQGPAWGQLPGLEKSQGSVGLCPGSGRAGPRAGALAGKGRAQAPSPRRWVPGVVGHVQFASHLHIPDSQPSLQALRGLDSRLSLTVGPKDLGMAARGQGVGASLHMLLLGLSLTPPQQHESPPHAKCLLSPAPEPARRCPRRDFTPASDLHPQVPALPTPLCLSQHQPPFQA